jgi:hypothetical protein
MAWRVRGATGIKGQHKTIEKQEQHLKSKGGGGGGNTEGMKEGKEGKKEGREEGKTYGRKRGRKEGMRKMEGRRNDEDDAKGRRGRSGV